MTPDGSATETPLATLKVGYGDARLLAYVRANLIKAGLALLVLVFAVGLAGILYERELLSVTGWIRDTLGLFGLALILFLSDSLITPIPPDFVLIVIAKSELHENWGIVIPALGALSTVAGNVAWFLGRKFGDTRFGQRLLGQIRQQNRELVARYGKWAVALGALTPIPYSLTCLTAGALKMPWRAFLSVSWLRIPRYVGYYVAFAYSASIARWLF